MNASHYLRRSSAPAIISPVAQARVGVAQTILQLELDTSSANEGVRSRLRPVHAP